VRERLSLLTKRTRDLNERTEHANASGHPCPHWTGGSGGKCDSLARCQAGGIGARRQYDGGAASLQLGWASFAARGVLPLEFKPTHSVGDLVLQHLDDLEQAAEQKGGVGQVVADHFARVYKVNLPQAA
jgi:hypothetical protein